LTVLQKSSHKAVMNMIGLM